MTDKFTKKEITALKEIAEEHMRLNRIRHGYNTNVKPNKFPKGYKGPRSFAEAMAMKWDSNKQKWSKK